VSDVVLRWYSQLLLGSLCAGLAGANAARPGAVVAAAAALAALGSVLVQPALRVPFLAAALVAAGWWWGGGQEANDGEPPPHQPPHRGCTPVSSRCATVTTPNIPKPSRLTMRSVWREARN